jgi:hypothetical protein
LNGVVGLDDFLSKWSRDDQMDRKLRRVLLDGIVRALISLKGGLDAGIFLPGLPRTEVEKLRDFFDQDSTGAEDRKQLLLSNVPFLNTIPKPYRNPSNMSAAFGIMCRRLNSFLEIHEGDALSKKLDRVREYPGMVPIVDLLLEAMKGEPGFLDRSELFGQLLKWETLSKDKSAGSELDKMEDRLFGPPETQTPGPTRRTPSTLAWFWQGKLNHSDIRANVTRRGPRESFVLAILAGMMTAVEASAGTLWAPLGFPAHGRDLRRKPKTHRGLESAPVFGPQGPRRRFMAHRVFPGAGFCP